ncbi:putative RNA methyltransferase/cg2084 [Microbacterium sp. TNHR37B]|nr:putative RNA methyltransferase/cg2084 [Microbacterium sp. TNHR37B]
MWKSRGVTGAEIELDITDVAHGGVFVARHVDADTEARGGRVVFVPDTLPGERVRVRIVDDSKPAFWRAELVEVLEPSPHRRPHVWSTADVSAAPEDRPGGADFGHIALAHQRELKTRVIADALARVGHVELPVTLQSVDAETPDGTRWRTRVRLHADDEGRVGPYAARSHRVIPVDSLPLATDAIEEVAAQLARRAGGAAEIDLVQPADGRVRVIERAAPPAARPGGRRRGSRGAAPEAAGATETVIELVGGREFRVDAGGVWQVHRSAAATLSAALADALRPRPIDPDAWHLDLYGGVGLLAAAVATLGGSATRITTVESDALATEHAGENLAEWVGARAETSRVDRWLAHVEASASAAERERLRRGVVVLDPPRAGAGRDVVERIARLSPERVAYVACDPVALARDLGTFRQLGYEGETVSGFDLFPNSHHVEALVVLTRDRPGS